MLCDLNVLSEENARSFSFLYFYDFSMNRKLPQCKS